MRKTFAIPGGIHPPENKQQSLRQPIKVAGLPPQLVLPLSQHLGAPATPLVQVGEQVLKGQKIAKATGPVSAGVHAPTSGTITAIGMHPLPHASGMQGRCITLVPDGRDTWCELHPINNYRDMDGAVLLERIRISGIAGMGGAGFPAAIKLAGKPGSKIHSLIINGTECEPYITADDALMRERARQIVAGIQILQHIVQPQETLLGIEDNKPEAIAAMQKACADSTIEVVSFPTKYPSGGEKQLIQILTGKEVPSGGLPADVGVLVQNLGTVVAVHQAITLGQPLISRITTVTGEAVQPQNFEVLLGSPVDWLLQQAGLQSEQLHRLVMGGPMMGFSLQDLSVPVVKTTNCLLAASRDELPPPPAAQACIRCGMCAQACPASLLPQQLYWFAQGKEYDKLEQHNLADCIECGCCSYVCPSNIPLVQYYRASKAAIRQQKADHKQAEYAKQRFEARQARLEREAAEKEAKRKARQAAAASKAKGDAETSGSGDDKAAIIAAAMARTQAKKAAAVETATVEAATVEAATVEAAAVEAATVETAAVEAATAAVTSSGDAGQDAIARAQAKRAGAPTAEPSPAEKIARLEQRLANAQQKYAAAQAAGSDKLDAFKAGVDKLTEQLAQARQQAEQAEQE